MSGVLQWQTKQIKVNSLVGSNTKRIHRVSNNLDRKSQTSPVNRDPREMSNSGELQAANRSKVTNSVAALVMGKKANLRMTESAHKHDCPLPSLGEGAYYLSRQRGHQEQYCSDLLKLDLLSSRRAA